jgi:hypothetical protein
MINGGTSLVSSIAPLSDNNSPDKTVLGNNLVSDMQSAFNNLRPFDSDGTQDEFQIEGLNKLNHTDIAAGG